MGPQRSGCQTVEATARVSVLDTKLGSEDGMVVAGCGEGTDGPGEGRRPGPKWDVREVEWVECDAAEEGVERCGRYTQGDCRSPNGPSSGRARQARPSLHMPDKIRSGHAAMYDRPLGLQLRMVPGPNGKSQ